MKAIATTFLVLLLASATSAQALSGTFSPRVPAPGQPITFTMTDAAGMGITLPSPCTWFEIRRGSQTGPQVQLGLVCIQVLVPVGANGSTFFTWDQTDINGRTVPPDTYWFRGRAFDAGFNPVSDWFCVTIQPAGEPKLDVSSSPKVNTATTLTIDAPNDPGAIYFLGMSATANNPLQVVGLDICLSAPLFTGGLSAPFGPLDAGGSSGAITLNVPNLPSLAFQGLHAQGVLLSGGSFRKTNALAMTIVP